ncbi:carbohydrate sulfotransferase 15 isoform X1 [Strongylocentrotus purpuratus]|uniref:Sulfotransferase domain-containing protein n=1 Tax=Strongylocentrotus purpuratus TaxID=7668 RepID=A0A7M7SZJ0_STRPU|nr:carbohydrate sulfotransferase 15 isoform X1 [Strongylocentrotus purpuratus]|eukprot:XP_011669938.1 PREDICTED: carbohydrate sulfotransferase 15 isoform X2 [Strongylocentrotus purpuratus]
MHIKRQLAAGIVLLNIALFSYVYYNAQEQKGYAPVNAQTSNEKDRGYAKTENEYSQTFSSKRPGIQPSKMKNTDDLHNLTANTRKEGIEIHNIDVQQKTRVGPAEFWRPELNLSSLPPGLYKRGKPVFDSLPKTYLPGYKSACWKLKGELKCWPYFYLLGMPKCGTTDLWSKITMHPDVKYTVKEPHWWARVRLGLTLAGLRPSKKAFLVTGNLAGYASRSNEMVQQFKLHPSMKSRLIIGDGSASTFWDNSLWDTWDGKRYEGPEYVTADVINVAQPDAKLIVILRNPVDRVYSDYLYFNPIHIVSVDHFHTMVVEVIDRFNTCLQTMSFRGCTYSIKQIDNQPLHTRLLVGLYAVYVRDWFRVYPRDQLKIMRLEDWHINCTGLLPEVFDFLNLEKKSGKTIAQFCEKKLQNGNKVGLHAIGDMLPKTRKLLEDFYESPNKELSLLLGDDKYLWRT